MTDYTKIGQEMALLGTYDDFSLDQIFEVLRAADEAYHENGAAFIGDGDYDSMRRYAQLSEPHNPYFTGVGSNERGGKIPLPYPMGSLDQVEVGELSKWLTENGLNDELILATEKLDGVSAMVVYGEDGKLQIAYSRGDGIQGADITRHVRHIVPTQIDSGDESFVIRGEIIISKANFPVVQSKFWTSGGEVYKNARNMVAGCMNASERDLGIYEYIDFVAYEIVKPDDVLDKNEQLDVLAYLGFKKAMIPYSGNGRDFDDDTLARVLNELRSDDPKPAEVASQYEVDGLVLDVNSLAKREKMNPTRDTLNPKHAIKYKVQDASNLALARVIEVQWNASKHGFMKPRVRVEPIQLVGVTIQHATGFNAKFIYDNGIGPGAVVQITRSGDVIPFIQAVPEPATAQMPSESWKWNDTGVDAVLDESTDAVVIEQMVAFFDSIDAPLLKAGNITKLHEMGFDVAQIIQADSELLVNVLGANGAKVHDGLRAKLTDIPLYRLFGAFSNERGLGVRKSKKLQQALGHKGLLDLDDRLEIETISAVDGFDHKTAQKVLATLNEFGPFLDQIDGYYTFDETGGFVTGAGAMTDQKVVFTGFRDKSLEAAVEAAGGTMQSGVSGKTNILVASNPTSNSGKAKKARDLGVRVIGVDELKDELGI